MYQIINNWYIFRDFIGKCYFRWSLIEIKEEILINFMLSYSSGFIALFIVVPLRFIQIFDFENLQAHFIKKSYLPAILCYFLRTSATTPFPTYICIFLDIVYPATRRLFRIWFLSLTYHLPSTTTRRGK